MALTVAELPRYHDRLSEILDRPPGVPPSGCRGALHRVEPDGSRIDPRSSPVLDDCQAGEGEVGQSCAVTLWKCAACRHTLVVAECPDGRLMARNEWSKDESVD